MFSGSPIRAIMDNAGAKLPSGASGWGADSKTQFGFGGQDKAFGAFIKPRTRLQPQGQTLMGEDQSRPFAGGGSNVFR